jgi:hypothetical protein
LTASKASSSHSKTRAGPVKTCCPRGHARDLHDGTFGGKVALEAHDAAGLGDRGGGGVDDLAIGLALDQVELFAHGAARHGHAILVDQTDLAQLLHHDGHAACLVEILGDVLAARLHVDEIGRVAEDVADIEEVEVDPGLMRDGGQVQARIGRAAGAGHDARRVFQRLAGDDVARADALSSSFITACPTPCHIGRGSRRARARPRNWAAQGRSPPTRRPWCWR